MNSSGAWCYELYGFSVQTPLPFHHCERIKRRPDIQINTESPAFFLKIQSRLPVPARFPEVYYQQLPDASEYLRLFNTFDFWISPNGSQIAYQVIPDPGEKRDPKNIRTSLINCLQTNVMSFAIMKRGSEPIHASAVVVNESAVAFLGDSGLGKSTLTAAFIDQGYPMLTDDILAVKKNGRDFIAAASTPCLKLFSKTARRVFKKRPPVGPMYPRRSKLVFPLAESDSRSRISVPLKAFYLLRVSKPGGKKIRLERLKNGRASLEMVRSTYNCMNQNPKRLKRQFLFAAQLTSEIPVFALTYPRDFNYLSDVRNLILRSLEGLPH